VTNRENAPRGTLLTGIARLRVDKASTVSGKSWVVSLLVLAVAALMPLFVSGYQLFELELVLLYVSAATGLNVAVGYAGEFLLCQAPVMGVGAYMAGILTLRYGWPVWATIPMAIIGAVVWQVVIGLAGLRVRGLYLGLLSFFSVLVFPDVILLAQKWTGGSDGLIGLPPLVPSFSFGAQAGPYEIALGVLAVSVLLVANLVRSGWGVRLRYLRDAPLALGTVGLSVARTKMTSYVVSAIPAGLAGWCLAYVNQSVTASIFGVSLTLVLFAGVQLIGPGTLIGPIIGAGLLEGYSQLVGPFSEYNVLGLGLLLAVAVIALPGGLRRAVSSRFSSRPSGLESGKLLQVDDSRRAAADRQPVVTGAGDIRLRVTDVAKSFGGNHAVRDASFDVRAGRIVALMGENGSGKTTLVNLISGFLKPDAGSIEIGGRSTKSRSPAEVARLGCARTFQVPQVVGELTVRQNVEAGILRRHCVSPVSAILLPLRSRRIDRQRRAEAGPICADLGFSPEALDTSVDNLPLGLRRLVEVGRAIAADAKVLILDEPSAGLNPEELTELSLVLRELKAMGLAVLLVEHNVGFVLHTCDDVVLMRMGEIAGTFGDIDPDNLPDALRRHLRTVPAGVE
jgi:branched-chain amino acid transport system permease protein